MWFAFIPLALSPFFGDSAHDMAVSFCRRVRRPVGEVEAHEDLAASWRFSS